MLDCHDHSRNEINHEVERVPFVQMCRAWIANEPWLYEAEAGWSRGLS